MTDVIDFQRSKDDITLSLLASSSTGLLLYVKGGHNDYIMLKVENGTVVFEVKYGTGMESCVFLIKLLAKMSEL